MTMANPNLPRDYNFGDPVTVSPVRLPPRLVDQNVFGTADSATPGNCLQACFASIFDLPLEEVPHFVGEPDWPKGMDRFLQPRGLSYVSVNFNEYGKYYPLNAWTVYCGDSPRGQGMKHAVVARNGEIVHDPHPSRDGLAGEPTSMYVFIVQDPK